MIELLYGDCLDLMKDIPDKSIDAIITDPPYGTTACKWDSVIPFDEMWEQLNRIIKPNGAIVLFGSEPFSSALRMSNIENYKYDWVWDKKQISNPFQSKVAPLKQTENICVFNKHKYFPIMEILSNNDPRIRKNGRPRNSGESVNGKHKESIIKENNIRFPKNILQISNKKKWGSVVHPTQKPVALMEYLIKTYTQKNETVLDFTMGSGSTGVACINTGRKFIGIEKKEKYFEIAKDRITEAQQRV